MEFFCSISLFLYNVQRFFFCPRRKINAHTYHNVGGPPTKWDLALYQTTIFFYLSKFKAFSDGNFNVATSAKLFFVMVEVI